MFLEFCYSLILGLSQTKETFTKGDILNAISLHMFLEFCYSLILGLSQTKETVTKGDILNASTGVNFKESLKKLQDLFPHFDWENSSFDTIR